MSQVEDNRKSASVDLAPPDTVRRAELRRLLDEHGLADEINRAVGRIDEKMATSSNGKRNRRSGSPVDNLLPWSVALGFRLRERQAHAARLLAADDLARGVYARVLDDAASAAEVTFDNAGRASHGPQDRLAARLQERFPNGC